MSSISGLFRTRRNRVTAVTERARHTVLMGVATRGPSRPRSGGVAVRCQNRGGRRKRKSTERLVFNFVDDALLRAGDEAVYAERQPARA